MKKLVCIGGGEIPRYKDGILLPYETKEIDEEIVRLSGKETPKLLFISIASSHPDEYFNGINKVYTVLGCIVNHLNINQSYEELKKEILGTDIIYIGGGNTARMMRVFKRNKVNEYLKLAYEKGIILTGLSAGAMCYFTNGYSDSNRSTNPEASLCLVKCLDIIPYCFCPHYNEQERKSFDEFVKNKHFNGLALEDNTALVYIDGEIKGIIKSDDNYEGYFISENEKIKIEVI